MFILDLVREPKDNFPLPKIDQLVDATMDQEMLSVAICVSKKYVKRISCDRFVQVGWIKV